MAEYPILNTTQQALKSYAGPWHPSLLLDTYVPHGSSTFDKFDQEAQFKHLEKITRDFELYGKEYGDDLLKLWDEIYPASSEIWSMQTVWHLAAHLSRSTAMENAAICLHPVYGFPYLPGSGLKGVASSWAELNKKNEDEDAKNNPDEEKTQVKIDRIFGKQTNGGTVVFLDAWPAAWPKLKVDIVNSHHPDYYGKPDDPPAPGDWESPNPVYFLVVDKDCKFNFAVAKAGINTEDKDLETAKTWLMKGLKDLGFGAKTAAGYGYFVECETPSDSGPLGEFITWLDAYSRSYTNPSQKSEAFTMFDALAPEYQAEAARLCLEKLPSALLDHTNPRRPGQISLRQKLENMI